MTYTYVFISDVNSSNWIGAPSLGVPMYISDENVQECIMKTKLYVQF